MTEATATSEHSGSTHTGITSGITSGTTSGIDTEIEAERADLIATLEKHRGFLLYTVRGLDDEQARLTPTVSALSLGGLIKHVTETENTWLDFIEHGAPQDDGIDWSHPDPSVYQAFANGFKLLPEETLAGVLDAFEATASRAVDLARTVELSEVHPLPQAPWFEQGAAWSNRRVFMHLVAETAQHAGHADILRESIDGQKTMG